MNDERRDLILKLLSGTCLLAGVVTFSILGHMAHNQGVEVKEVVNSGPGLVFITYPEVVLKMTGGSLWAIIFFFMLVVSVLRLEMEYHVNHVLRVDHRDRQRVLPGGEPRHGDSGHVAGQAQVIAHHLHCNVLYCTVLYCIMVF